MLRTLLALTLLLAPALPAQPNAPAARFAVIDMHLHVGHGTTAREWKALLADHATNDVVLATLLVHDTAANGLAQLAPHRFLVGASFPCHEGTYPPGTPCFAEWNGWPQLSWLRRQYESKRLQVMGELLNVYYGMSPGDPRLEPYWALAEELDVPVGIHTGRGPGPKDRAPGCCPHFNDDYGNPALLEPVMQRYPRLRIWLMHGGGEFMQETIALMKAHPAVYADMSIINSVAPPAIEAMWLRTMREAGVLDRVMFGSDNMPLAATIARSRDVPFLSDAERRALLCGNAAQFLRLDAAVCAER
jgi:hypothetical protein